jgi:hypothetical protein
MDWSISLYHRLFIGKHQKDPSGSTELSAPEYFGRDMFEKPQKFMAPGALIFSMRDCPFLT